MAVQTAEVKGQICIVVHLMMDDGVAFCNGEPIEHPSENDKRPRTFCPKCRKKSLEKE